MRTSTIEALGISDAEQGSVLSATLRLVERSSSGPIALTGDPDDFRFVSKHVTTSGMKMSAPLEWVRSSALPAAPYGLFAILSQYHGTATPEQVQRAFLPTWRWEDTVSEKTLG